MQIGLSGNATSTGLTLVLVLIGLFHGIGPVAAAEDRNLAFDDKFMFRISSYYVRDADTDIAVADPDTGIGAAYSFSDNFGGEDSVRIPRIDAYYRFNDKHRIDFSAFQIDRSGKEVLLLEVELEEDTFSAGDTISTDIRYELFKVGYGYSFYRSDQVELSFTAGLNITTYEFEYELEDGDKGDTSDATGPLPMFGLTVSYAITPKLSVHFLAESFYIEIDDSYEGSFTTNELHLEYRFNRYFSLGAGLTRFSTDLDADEDDWKGSISDSHRGGMIYAAFYL